MIAIALTLLIGLCVGSFLNVVIYRLPKNMSLIKPKSHCTNCDYSLKWYDNIPVFSYIFLRGKCRKCGSKISFRYPFVEILNMVLWFLSLLMFTDVIIESNQPNYLLATLVALAFSVLVCIMFCDFDNMEIPDELQICLLILGILSFLSNDISASQRVFGFLFGAGFFGIFAVLFYLIKKREGLGFGDIKLMAVLGLLLGLYKTILCVALSAILGAIILTIIQIKNKGEKNREYPFAVFIVPCAIVSMLVGQYVVDWYLSLFQAI